MNRERMLEEALAEICALVHIERNGALHVAKGNGPAFSDAIRRAHAALSALSQPEPSSDVPVSASLAADDVQRSLPHTRPGRIFHDGHGLIWAPSLKGGDTRIADVRGWGYLTGGGHGALNLPGEVALATQLAWADAIAEALNAWLATGDGSSQQNIEAPSQDRGEAQQPLKMLVDADWLRRRTESEPDGLDVEAGTLVPLTSRMARAQADLHAELTECAFVDHRGNELRCSAAVYQEIRRLREQPAHPQPTGGNVWRGIESAPRDGTPVVARAVDGPGLTYDPKYCYAAWWVSYDPNSVGNTAEMRKNGGHWARQSQVCWPTHFFPLPPASSDPRPLDLGGRDE